MRNQWILRVDSGAALVAGVVVLAAHPWLASLYAVPTTLVVFIAVVNLAYGVYSGRLALQVSRGRAPAKRAIAVLIAGNASWGVVCVVLAAVWAREASALFLATLLGEGAFVVTLAVLEARWLRSPA